MSHPVLWFEVLGTDGEVLQQFYHRLFGWYINADNPMKYGMVETASTRGIQGGVGQVYDERTRPWVTFYVETPDITATLAQAAALGGKVLMDRHVMETTTIGLFEDPEGHVVGLVEAPRPEPRREETDNAGFYDASADLFAQAQAYA